MQEHSNLILLHCDFEFVCYIIVTAFKLYNVYFCNNMCPLFVYFAVISQMPSQIFLTEMPCFLFQDDKASENTRVRTQYIGRGLGRGGGEVKVLKNCID